MLDRAARPEAGPSGTEIEVTPEMIAAGDEVLSEYFYDAWEMTKPEYKREFLIKIFQTMSKHRTF